MLVQKVQILKTVQEARERIPLEIILATSLKIIFLLINF